MPVLFEYEVGLEQVAARTNRLERWYALVGERPVEHLAIVLARLVDQLVLALWPGEEIADVGVRHARTWRTCDGRFCAC